MAGDNDDPVFRAGKIGDDFVDGKLSVGRVGGEGVVLDLVAFEMGEQIVFDLLVIGAADGTGAERYDVFHVLEGAGAINCRPRTSVGWERKLGESRVSWSDCGRGLRCRRRGILVAVAGHESDGERKYQNRKRSYLHHGFSSRFPFAHFFKATAKPSRIGRIVV